MANTEWKYFLPKFLLAHPEKHIQNLLAVIFSIIQEQNILFFHFRKKYSKRTRVITYKALIAGRKRE